MKEHAEWIALCYSVPASPSKARVFVWRRLRALGAQSIRPGLAALPYSGEGETRLSDLAQKIREDGGESLLLEMDLLDGEETARLRERFADAQRRALRETIEQCTPLLERFAQAEPAERAQLARSLYKKLGKLGGREANPLLTQMSELERTAGSLFETLRGLPAEFSAMLRGGEKREKP